MANATTDSQSNTLTRWQKARFALDMYRHADAVIPAMKRAATTIHTDGWGGAWGEPPPASVTAEPVLYVKSGPVFEAVNVFGQLVATTPLKLFERQADGELEEVRSHPVIDLIADPNEFWSRSDLFMTLVGDRKLNGNAYWFLAGPNRGAPSEIWWLDPRHTRVVRDKQKYIIGYVTEVDGNVIPLDPQEVIHFRNFNPFDKFYGIGDLAAAALPAVTGRNMEEWNRNMFARDHAIPAGIVSVEGRPSDPDWERFKEEWKSSYGGGQRKTAFVRGGDSVSVAQLGLSQTDVDFLNGIQWEAESVYRIMQAYILRSAQYAEDAKVQERLFLQAVWALLDNIAEKLTDDLLTFWGPRLGTGKLIAKFEDIRPRERSLDLEEDREESKGLTLNEWRKRRGLDPLDGGNDILFVHVQSGEKVAFERDALPEPAPVPPQLQPFQQQQPNEEPDTSTREEDADEKTQEAENRGSEVGDDVGERFNKAAVGRELSNWQKYELRRLESGKDREFEPERTPRFMADLITTALAECEDADGIKAIFKTWRSVLLGEVLPEPAAKASFGTPEGTVVLYLDNKQALLTVQQMLMRSIPSDAPVRWTPVEQLHITVVFAPIVDEPAFRDIFQETAGSFNGLPVTSSQIGTFESSGDAIPIIALVDRTDELDALQAEVWAGFAARGIAVSEYSQPDAWQPHITLGYVDAEYGTAGMSLPFDIPEIVCTAKSLAFTRGDYVNLFVQRAVPVPLPVPQPEPEVPTIPDDEFWYGDYEAESIKAIQATRLLFEMDFSDLLSAFRAGDINRRTWSLRLRTLLRKFGQMAYRDGLNDGGVIIGEDEAMGTDDQAEVNRLLAEQGQYVTNLGGVLKEGEISDDQAAGKPVLWWNKSVMPLYEAGRLSAAKNAPHIWTHNPLKKNCRTCLTASGQIHRLKDWHASGILPLADILICKGFRCGCRLLLAYGEKARGRLDRIPLAIKTNHEDHDEGDPMATKPDALPGEIWAELDRVLGKRIIAASETAGTFTLTFSEEAGFYKAEITDDETAQRGLSMINDRLALVDYELVGDTDLTVRFTVEEGATTDGN